MEVEQERQESGVKFRTVESKNKDLETINSTTIEENKYLLAQLEGLNNDLTESSSQVVALNTALDSTKKELNRLASLAAQTSSLEAQLSTLEVEQAKMQSELLAKGEETETAIQRYWAAERTISDLTDQLNRIEKEHKEDCGRHNEVIKRLERRNAVQKEVNSATTRRKQSGTQESAEPETSSNSIVSTFVKEILEDNANLQMGIIELREMLSGSNEEIHHLREQAAIQQNQTQREGESRLHEELGQTKGGQIPLHVHHHYHAAPKTEHRKDLNIQRPKRKRYISSPGFRSPNAGSRTPQTPRSPANTTAHVSSTATILSQTSASIPGRETPLLCHRLPSQPSSTPFSSEQRSVGVSPSSSYQEQSVFDLTDETTDFSRPTTPASTSIGSPYFPSRHHKQGSDVSVRSFSAQPLYLNAQILSSVLQSPDTPAEHFADSTVFPLADHETIPEETEEDLPRRSDGNDHKANKVDNGIDRYEIDFPQITPRLHRASSAESIFSNKGLDLARLRGKRSQLLSNPQPSMGALVASVQPVTSSMAAKGRNSTVSGFYDSSRYNRLLLASNSPAPPASKPQAPKQPSRIGKTLGGWMVGKWGSTPTHLAPDTCPVLSTITTAPVLASSLDKPVSGSAQDIFSLRGTQVEAVKIDNAMLKDALGGD